MSDTVPKLEDYDVFPNSGFLPAALPLERLPQEYYKPWEDIVANLPALILTKRVRKVIDSLEKLSVDQLENIEQYRRAYQVLGFLGHAYVWGTDKPTDKLPANIADAWIATAEYLRLPPIGTYASLCLWNFKQIIPSDDRDDEFWDLDNLTTINTFTGSIDESWFYLISVYFEYKGSFAINVGLQAMKDAYNNDTTNLTKNLQELAQRIDHLGSVLMRMEEMCDPHVFYYRIRPYLAGWKNMADVGLEKGVYYGDEAQPRSYAGGSNAQSSLIQFLDVLLGIKHYSTGERPLPHEKNSTTTNKPESSFMNEMRSYMPGKHSDFLQAICDTTIIHDYVLANGDSNPELTLSFDACLAMIKSFRDKHIQIVTRYIVLQAKKTNKLGSSSTLRSGLSKKKKEEKGTGGTSLLPFLKQCRDETGDPAAGTWGRRILSDGVMRLNLSKPNGINEDDD